MITFFANIVKPPHLPASSKMNYYNTKHYLYTSEICHYALSTFTSGTLRMFILLYFYMIKNLNVTFTTTSILFHSATFTLVRGEKVNFCNAGPIRYSYLAWLLAVGSGNTDPEAKPIYIPFPLSLLFIAATADPETMV